MRLRLIVSFLCTVAALPAATAFDRALSLYHQKRYPEARAALQQVVATDPANAAACQYLGLTLSKRNDPAALGQALPWLEKAVALRPDDPDILGDFGGLCLLYADQHRSLTYALKGRDAMERSLSLDPTDLDVRDGLMQFYAEAPWPIGSGAKARQQAEEISRRDADRGLLAFIYLRRAEKKPEEIFALCEQALQRDAGSYLARYEFARAAAETGSHVDRAIVLLKECLTLAPSHHAPGPAGVQYRLGLLYEKQGDVAAARAAYRAAVALDASNRPAAEALARLK